MLKVKRYDYHEYDTEFGVQLWHWGDWFPGADRRHELEVVPSLMLSWWADAIFYHFTLDGAIAMAKLLIEYPTALQACCFSCHPTRHRPIMPRWDQRPDTPDSKITPVTLGYVFEWPDVT